MAIQSQFSDFRTAGYSKLYWLAVDVTLQDISFGPRAVRNRIADRQQPLFLDCCVLEGWGAVATALTVGPEGMGFDQFTVGIDGYIEDDRNNSNIELRQSAKLTWNKMDD